jgi:hypothetical protein
VSRGLSRLGSGYLGRAEQPLSSEAYSAGSPSTARAHRPPVPTVDEEAAGESARDTDSLLREIDLRVSPSRESRLSS